MANLWNNLPRCGGLKEDGYLMVFGDESRSFNKHILMLF